MWLVFNEGDTEAHSESVPAWSKQSIRISREGIDYTVGAVAICALTPFLLWKVTNFTATF